MTKKKGKIDLEKQVMQKLHDEKITMRPRIYFVAGSLLLGAGFAGMTLIAVLIFTRTLFHLRVHGPFGYLMFGQFGLKAFFATFPLGLLILTIAAVGVGVMLLRRYDVSYKHSLTGLALGLIAFILTTGFILDRVGFNERIEKIGRLRPLVQNQFTGRDWVAGEVLKARKDQLIVETPQGKVVTVEKNEKTLLPFGGDFHKGDRIRAVGEWEEGVFVAKGIGKGGLKWRRFKKAVQGVHDVRRFRKIAR